MHERAPGRLRRQHAVEEQHVSGRDRDTFVFRTKDGIDMEPEGGVIRVYGPGDDSVIAFSPFNIERLRELIEMEPEHAR